MSCDELHKAIHEMRSEDIVQCWMNIAHHTIDELKGKSASSSLKRSRSTPIPTQSQHNSYCDNRCVSMLLVSHMDS